jgi:BirA family biotin operon repressor/biotin-[acetyl-CoA-carboxylase] ligase
MSSNRARLDVTAVRRDLVGPDRPWHRLDVVETTGSTNTDLLARHGAGEDIDGAVLIAEHQSAGRGRNGRAWSTPPRSQIALSVGIAASGVPPAGWGWIPLMTGVAVVEVVRATTGVDAKLKWPNDVLVGGEKLAGILAEVAAPDPVIVVGLGLNVTLTPDEAPDPRATSLLMLGSTMLDRSALLGAILAELSTRIDRWRSAGGPDALLLGDYRRLSSTLGTRVCATLPGGRDITGVATDLDESGQLFIDTGTQTVAVSAGDITHLRTAKPA